ncbi:hypothetical protein V8E36_001580 [Tilletia maclaganii]
MAEAFAVASGQELHFYYATDKIGRGNAQRALKNAAAAAAWAIPPKKAGDLCGRLPLLRGMPVFCTENIATELGICNGSSRSVVDVTYEIDGSRRYAVSVEVDFPGYTNSKAREQHPHRVCLKPVKAPFTYTLPNSEQTYSATRWQIPLMPAFAYTCHNSQGRSLNCATIDLASATSAQDKTALAYVMLSRLRSLDGLTILRPFPMSVISCRAAEQVRKELTRIDTLSSQTKEWAEQQLAWYYSRSPDERQS